ncbi:hypothetical protein [Serratia proteamaculans]|uniref:hypothetical protein n=1 Tax=Serratia proteamaculans TaxID=28151 RepID=UPI0039AF5903
MSQQITEELVFRPASELPTEDLDGRDVIVINPCDGWHIGEIRVDRDGDDFYIGIYDWPCEQMYPHSFYVAWALLPDSIELSNKFESERRRR